MKTTPFDPDLLSKSVIAVPPLSRDDDYVIDGDENDRLIRHIESGGVRCLLYGGNAVQYHGSLSEYDGMLSVIADSAGMDTTVVPSLGPSLGIAMDQAEILRDFEFSTAMVLPTRDIVDPVGIARGCRMIAETLGRPIVLYIKFDRWIDVDLVAALERDGVISWIKYAVVRDDPAKDDYLRELLDVFPAARMVSGIGEQPAITHMRDFGLVGFTSGCVCVAPQRSMDMFGAIGAGDYELAEEIRAWFQPLENLRDSISPIRVLHHAVQAAGIATTGPLLPMLSELSDVQIAEITAAVAAMRDSA